MYLAIVSFLAIIGSLGGTSGEEVCYPQAIENLQLSNGTLTWTLSESESCDITDYVIYIDYGNDFYKLQTKEPTANVDPLEPCIIYSFSVYAVANAATLGPEVTIFKKYSLHPGTAPTLSYLNVTETEQGVNLQWAVDQLENCIDAYRVRATNEEGYVVVEKFVSGTTTDLSNLVPCTTYQFSVDVVYDEFELGDLALVNYTTPASVAESPLADNGYAGLTTYNITLHFDRYSKNRCPITGLLIDGANYSNETVPIDDSLLREYTLHFKDLNPGYIYLVYISVLNNAGQSIQTVITAYTLEDENEKAKDNI